MVRYRRRPTCLIIVLQAAALLAPWAPRTASLARSAGEGMSGTFLPLLLFSSLASTPTPTPTSAPTPTPTPTTEPPACPLHDVTGSYRVETSNLDSDCPGATIEPPPDSDVKIIQDGETLTLRSNAGDATGTIDSQTGDFEVVVIVEPSAELCLFGCVNTTTGTFRLGQDPMTFAGAGRLDVLGVLGGTLCSVTYDLDGTRTACADARTASRSCPGCGR